MNFREYIGWCYVFYFPATMIEALVMGQSTLMQEFDMAAILIHAGYRLWEKNANDSD